MEKLVCEKCKKIIEDLYIVDRVKKKKYCKKCGKPFLREPKSNFKVKVYL
jgi:rRNA maturation endonuclease Nob1